jgi:hypothetical protein
MGNRSVVKRPAVRYFAFLALIVMTMMTALTFGAVTAHAGQAKVTWGATTTNSDGTPITDLGGYNVYVGTAPGSYAQKYNAGDVNSYLVANLNAGTTYYFAVTSYNTAGLESGYSNQASTTFAATPVTYTITASAGAGGTVTAVSNSNVSVASNGTSTITSVQVASGSNQSFNIAAASGYKVADVQVDGKSVGAVTSYSFSNVTATHSLSASFTASTTTTPPPPTTTTTYSITASAGSNGTISPAGTATVAKAGSQSYTVTPNTGYYIVSVAVDGATVASNVAGGAPYSYTFSNVSANHTISATFAVRYYNIVSSAGTYGSVSPTSAWVIYQGSQKVAITPASGHTVSDVLVDGKSVGAVTSYTFSTVSADHRLSATFK